MDNELMDFTPQKNFDFFKYRYEPQGIAKQTFLQDCQKVLEGAHATMLETLKLAARMAKLKKDGAWKEVINPETGDTFNYASFEAFSKYAFGFGKTRTSNFLSLAEFVELDEQTGEILYKDARYRSMNMSQLIELAPLSESTRTLFSSKISVADMRLCKKYTETSEFWRDRYKEDFDLLSSAKAWTVQQQQKKEQEEAERIDRELDAAAEGTAEDETFFGFTVPTSELKDCLDENSDVGILNDRKYSFASRTSVRKFLADFESWEQLGSNEFFDSIRVFGFKNGMGLYAATCKICVTATWLEEKEMLFFFLYVGKGNQPIKISKQKLEIWLKAHERELL